MKKTKNNDLCIDDDFIYKETLRIHTKIMEISNEQALKAIEDYCIRNNIIPNIIRKEQLDLVLKLGIAEYQKRYMEDQ